MNDTKGCPKILSSQFEILAFDRPPQYIFLFWGEGGEVGGREGELVFQSSVKYFEHNFSSLGIRKGYEAPRTDALGNFKMRY